TLRCGVGVTSFLSNEGFESNPLSPPIKKGAPIGAPFFIGGVLNPFEFESSTLTIVLQQIIALKTTKAKFYVATVPRVPTFNTG
ncbi:MAG: hypothetical protein ABW097_20825, partial [Candidatus Thiodiazotropha lotti]